MPKILCPVDLSHEASYRIAIPEAVREARARGADLHLLAVVPSLGSFMVAERFPADFERDILAHAAEDLDKLAKAHVPDEVSCTTHVGHGHAAEEILAAAERLGPDLIVMASHRPDALRTLFVGSVADKIVHNANCSVLVARG